MLEIFLIYLLCKKCYQTAKLKGYSGGLFGFMAAALWIVCEFSGMILSAILTQGKMGAAIYIFGLLGAGFGALIAWLIVYALKDRGTYVAPNEGYHGAPPPAYSPAAVTPISQPSQPHRWCIKCGTQLQDGGRFCIKCGAPAQGV